MPPVPPRHAAIGFILATVTLDILAMSMVIPVLPRLVLSFEGGSAVNAAHMLGVFGTAWALMQFLFSPVQGALSDRFGRRPVILLSNLGLGLDYVLMALAPTVWWLFVGRVISGITAASFSSANAYIADISTPETRAARFGLISVAFGFGFVAGPAIGGLLGSIDPRLPFWVSAGLSLANFAFGLIVLPESLSVDRRAGFSWRRANPLGSITLFRSRPGMLGLAATNWLYILAFNALPVISVLYTTYRYGWDQRTVGYMLGGIGICSAVVGAGFTGPVVRRFGERRALLAGLGFGIAGYTLMGLAPTGALYLAALPVLSLWGFVGPSLNSLMTRKVGANEQGRLAGANSSLIGIAGLIGPSLYTESFAHFVTPGGHVHLPGAPFLIGAALLAAALLAAWRYAQMSAPSVAAEPRGAQAR